MLIGTSGGAPKRRRIPYIIISSRVAMSNVALLSSLQAFLNQRAVEVERLTADAMIKLMVDWFRLVAIAGIEHNSPADTMLFRYGGWSEGCVTGFKFSVLRQVAEKDEAGTQWRSGITLMFEPSRYANIAPLDTVSTDWQSLEAFVNAIESSPGFRLSSNLTPMAVMLESQGAR
jgi:hypothetical protein